MKDLSISNERPAPLKNSAHPSWLPACPVFPSGFFSSAGQVAVVVGAVQTCQPPPQLPTTGRIIVDPNRQQADVTTTFMGKLCDFGKRALWVGNRLFRTTPAQGSPR
jgi:hypothetical protein